jgi:superfamily II RNA helicase
MSDILNTAPLAVDPTAHRLSPEEAFDHFLQFVLSTGAELYPAQEEAILEIMQGNSVILNTPTGSGKSLVATAHHFFALTQGRTSVYTAPIKALVSEKFFALCKLFGPQQVGMMTGDASINPSAPILCCTAEVLSQMALRFGDEARVHDVIMDEFHYYSDRDRGSAWQIPLLALPRCRFLLMSATLGDVSFIQQDLETRSGRTVATMGAVMPDSRAPRRPAKPNCAR